MRDARRLSWAEVDHYYHGYEARRQKELAGHRLIAVQVYNALAEKPLSAEQYLPLPEVDGAKAKQVGSVNPDWKKRMEAKYGNLLEA